MRTSRIYIIIFLFFFLEQLFSQGEFNNWYFGNKAGITFNNNPPLTLTDNNYISQYNPASISDSLGNFCFLATGAFVADKNMSVMPNGTGITGNYMLAIQFPDDLQKYYLFSTDGVSFPYISPHFGLRYSIINLNLNGGSGDVLPIAKNISITTGYWSSWSFAATKHQNNKDAWLIIRRVNLYSDYAVYKINSSGIDSVPVCSPSLIPNPTSAGQPFLHDFRFSPDGNKLIVNYGYSFEVSNFNKNTGSVTPLFTIVPSGPLPPYNIMGSEFSIDNHYLYVSTYTGNNSYDVIFQYDMNHSDSSTFKESENIIGYDRIGRINMQRGPDNKIYYSRQMLDSLSVIHNPEIFGSACNLQKNAISLNGRLGLYGMPDFVQRYYLYIKNSNTCTEDSVDFSMTVWPPVDDISWNFGDPLSGINNLSNQNAPSHKFSSAGTYIVELYVRHIDKRTDTVWKTIVVTDNPNPNLGNDVSTCAGNPVTFDAGACSGCTFEWKDLTTSAVVGTSQTYTATTQGNYEVTVTNTGGCAGKDTVQVSFSPPPQITNSPLLKSICSGESTNITLTSTVANTIFHWTASISSGTVSGFSADSGTVINQILSGSGVVNYHIIPKIGNCIGNAVDFPVTVTPGDSVKVSIIPSDNNICTGTSVTFTATPLGTGTLTYDWKVNGTSQGVNNSTFNYAPANGDVVTCVLSSSITTCVSNNPATSNSVTMIVNPLQPVTIAVVPSANNICQGTSVIFTANTTPAGGTKHYQWKVNDINVGTDNPVFTYVPANGDNVTCDLSISSLSCFTASLVTSQPVNMVVNPNVNLSVFVIASANPVCSGIPVTFTASAPPGGTATYQWKVNGISSGLNQNTFSYVPVNNDVVECGMSIAGMSCLQNNPATSNSITMGITAAPLVTFPACFDTITTTSAKPIHLKGAIPYGGTYSGPGVNSATGIFTPSLAGTGSKAITYTYTNAGLCSSFKVKNITVQPPAAFSCGNNFTDIRDNKSYKTIQIGSQCWMAEDLNFGSVIPQTVHQRDNCIAEKYAVSFPPPFGGGQEGAYQWDEVMDYSAAPGEKGLCPPGWHIPAESEWQTLFNNYSGIAFAASPLKYSGYSGFTALLTGTIPQNTILHFSNFASFYWTSTPHGTYKAWAHGFNDPDPSASTYPASRQDAFSVRCVKD